MSSESTAIKVISKVNSKLKWLYRENHSHNVSPSFWLYLHYFVIRIDQKKTQKKQDHGFSKIFYE